MVGGAVSDIIRSYTCQGLSHMIESESHVRLPAWGSGSPAWGSGTGEEGSIWLLKPSGLESRNATGETGTPLLEGAHKVS